MMITSRKRFSMDHTEDAHTRGLSLQRRTHVRASMKEDPRMFEIIISVDSDRRPLFPQCLVYASSSKLRGPGAPAREGHSLEERIAREEGRESEYGKIRNAGKRSREREREREELRKKIGREYPERLRKTWRHSPAAFCATLDRASQLGKSHTLAEPMSLPTNKQIEAVIIRDYRLLQLDDLALTHGSFIRQPSSLNARI